MVDFTFIDWALLLLLMFSLAGLAGFLAGLLGIGGGLVLVPGLYYVFSFLGYESPYIMHVCVGTSLATIIATGISSARAHHKRDCVRFDLVKNIGIGVVIGVGIGTVIASYVSGITLILFFAITLFILAGLMQIKPEKMKFMKDIPKQPWPAIAGTVTGTVSTLMGIGGAALNVPYMTLHNVSIHRAVGTASAMGLLVAIPGAIGFLIIGLLEKPTDLPPFSLGYINFLALAIIIPVSSSFAPVGAGLAHKFSTKLLRKVFSIFIIIVASKMLFEAWRVSNG